MKRLLLFVDWLRSEGFQVISKRTKVFPDGSRKCDMDIEMTVDAIERTSQIRPDVVVIGSGDGDFACLALYLRRKGIRVEVASLPTALANELRLAAQEFIDLTEWANRCGPSRSKGYKELQ